MSVKNEFLSQSALRNNINTQDLTFVLHISVASPYRYILLIKLTFKFYIWDQCSYHLGKPIL